eukprot:764456-Hanusia_phi.AAC.6
MFTYDIFKSFRSSERESEETLLSRASRTANQSPSPQSCSCQTRCSPSILLSSASPEIKSQLKAETGGGSPGSWD